MDISLIDDFKDSFMPHGFKWRKGQREAIESIIHAYEDGQKVVIVDAPVGSGKSLIAMCAAWILNKHGKKGYILASDISLQEQYESDIKKFSMNYGSVKGIDNYACEDNMEKNSLGTCRIRGKSPKTMPCYGYCPYFTARDSAAKAETSVLNYAYWLIMQNYTNQHSDEVMFDTRDFVICDEAHKILDIVQNQYSPRFDTKFIEKMEKITSFFDVHKLGSYSIQLQEISNNVKGLFRTEDQITLLGILNEIKTEIERYFNSFDKFKESVKMNYPHDTPPKDWREALRICDWIKDFHCKLEDFCDIIESTSSRNLVKNPSSDSEIVFNCLEESYLMSKYFHQWTKFTILMSATFADPRDYIKSMALTSAKYIRIPSTFNFDRSPIYFYNKRRMSYKQIDSNMPWLLSKIDEILDNHPNDNGIIHSASYNLSMKIINGLSAKNRKRLLIYNGTQEKKQVLNVLKHDRSKVLIGPSLLEGLDLKDSISRFQIFAKVPYLSLGDKFVKVKMQIDPNWYRWKAIQSTLQGLGRSIRHENDWAVTYFLDASLADLIHSSRNSFPPDFYDRLKVVSD